MLICNIKTARYCSRCHQVLEALLLILLPLLLLPPPPLLLLILFLDLSVFMLFLLRLPTTVSMLQKRWPHSLCGCRCHIVSRHEIFSRMRHGSSGFDVRAVPYVHHVEVKK